MMHRWWLLIAMLLAGCAAPPALPTARLSVAEALRAPDRAGFLRADRPRTFSFPADHGPHPGYAVEWWYVTANLATAEGRRFGVQFTLFHIALAPDAPQRASEWGSHSVMMGHFAVADIAASRFHAFERFSRVGAGLAGATASPLVRVWLEDWSLAALDERAVPLRIDAAQDGVAVALHLDAGDPPVLQGVDGLSQKSAAPGNASYYYSMMRLPTSGTIRVDGVSYAVSGDAWLDREWSTSALGEDQVGWDWFALQLDDGSELMYYQLRRRDGTADPASKGVVITGAGDRTDLRAADVQLAVTRTWRSPRTAADYPAEWRLAAPAAAVNLEITPLLADHELPTTVVYWEGAVRVQGTIAGRAVRGHGYVELTGYADDAAASLGR